MAPMLVLERVALAHDLLRRLGVVPEVRVLGLAVQLVEARCAGSQSKMPPQQPDRLLSGFREVLDLGAHDFQGLRVQEGGAAS